MGLVINAVFGGRTGDPGNVRQRARGSLGHGGAATLQQELPVVDYPGTFIGGRQDRKQGNRKIYKSELGLGILCFHVMS